jgi:hypothetical protein
MVFIKKVHQQWWTFFMGYYGYEIRTGTKYEKGTNRYEIRKRYEQVRTGTNRYEIRKRC